MESTTRLAYEIATRQLIAQKEDLRNLRNQASFAAAVTGLLATFFATMLGPQVLEDVLGCLYVVGIRLEMWLVVFAITGSICYAILVITGWQKVTFDLEVEWVLQEHKNGVGLESIYGKLAKDMDCFFVSNEEVVTAAKCNLLMSLILSFLQIPAWLLLF